MPLLLRTLVSSGVHPPTPPGLFSVFIIPAPLPCPLFLWVFILLPLVFASYARTAGSPSLDNMTTLAWLPGEIFGEPQPLRGFSIIDVQALLVYHNPPPFADDLYDASAVDMLRLHTLDGAGLHQRHQLVMRQNHCSPSFMRPRTCPSAPAALPSGCARPDSSSSLSAPPLPPCAPS